MQTLEDRTVPAINVAVVQGNDGSTGFVALAAQLNNDTFFDFNATVVSSSQVDTLGELNAYDAVVIGNSGFPSGDSFNDSTFTAALRSWVQAGGGVVATGWTVYGAGSTTPPVSADIDAIVPVNAAGSYSFDSGGSTVVPNGTSHPVTAGVGAFTLSSGDYAEFPGSSPQTDAGATVLATVNGQPTVVVGNVGAGRGVYLGPIYTGYSGYNNGELRTGNPDRLLEQAVNWVKRDTTPPTVTSTSPFLSGAPVAVGLSNFQVSFSETVVGADLGGNYELRSAGPDGQFGTGDDTLVPVSASSAGTTATLSFAPLTAGTYRLTVRDTIIDAANNRLDGDANGTATGDWVRTFSVALPAVTGTSPSLTAGTLAAGATTLQVSFNAAVVGGGTASNYDLRRAGADGLLGSTDDTVIPVSVSYSGSTATLTFSALAEDVYRLTVRDTITDSGGNRLDGDGDGAAGGNCVRDFVVLTTSAPAAPYRWATFNTYDNATSWLMGNNPAMYGGVAPSSWTDGGATAGQMTTDLNALAALFTNRGVAGPNATIYSGTDTQFSSTNGRVAAALFRVQNTTGSPILWTPIFNYSAYSPWGERASVAVNGVNVWTSNSDGLSQTAVIITIPANSTATVVFTSTDGPPVGVGGGLFERAAQLGFTNNSLALPAGLAFVDDLTSSIGTSYSLASPNGFQFDMNPRNFGTGEIVQGTNNAFDGLNRLQVNGAIFAPASGSGTSDNGRTLATGNQSLSGLTVSREVTVPATGSQDFARTVDVFTNPTAGPITTTVTLVGNLGSDAATTVFATSTGGGVSTANGVTTIDPANQWFATDDADFTGSPAVLHFVHGPSGLRPDSIQVIGDNVQWTYTLTVPAGQTVRLATFTLQTTRGVAASMANALVTPTGFAGQAAAFLTQAELDSLANFGFNQAPVAVDDSYGVGEDSALSPAAPGVLVNDTDVNGDHLTAALVTGPSHGTLTFNADGSFTYVPNANFNGTDSFTYRASDGSLTSNVATVYLTVISVNDAPVGTDDSYTLAEDTTLTIPAAAGVLSNDTDVDGDLLSAVLIGPPNGSLTLNPNGSFTYRPADDFFGTDSFIYRPNDGTVSGNFVAVTFTVTPVNDAPIANPDTATTNEDTAVNIPVLANDSPGPANESDQTLVITRLNGVSVSAGSVVATDHGTARLNVDGTVTYRPAPDYNGADGFTYEITDSGAPPASASTTGSVTINPVNDPPVATDDSYSIAEDGTLTGGVLGNDTDVDGDTLQVAAPRPVTAPSHGNLTLNADGSFTYVPFADFNGPDSFTYVATDGIASSNLATVRITVSPVNDAPVAVADAAVTPEDTSVSGNVLSNDTDVDGDPLRVKLGTGPAHGSVTLNSDGSFQYTPAANFNGTDSFTYRANDGSLTSAETTVTITVTPVNDPPVAADDAATTAEDTPATGNVLANDSDVDGDSLAATLLSGPVHGSIDLHPDGSFSYTPAPDFNGTDAFTYEASDGQGGTAVGTVTVTVNPVNDAPVADAGTDQAGSEGSPITLDGSGSSDVDDTNLTYAWDFGDGATGSGASVTHAYADNGTYTATLTVTDPSGAVGTDTVAVTVANVAPTLVLSGAADADEGSTYTLNLSASDPGADAIDHWTINWGDGTADQTVSGNPASVPHVFDDNGTYTISATATDEDATWAAGNTMTVAVANVAPVPSKRGGFKPFLEGTEFSTSASPFDPSHADRAAGFGFAWSVTRDGSPYSLPPGTVIDEDEFAFTPDDNGEYEISVTIIDKDGGVGTGSVTITVDNVAPTAAITGALASGPEGTEISLGSTVTDPGTADTQTYAWSVTKNDSPYTSGSGPAFAFTPNDNGSYAVTLTATDDDGGVGTDTQTVTVTNVAPTATLNAPTAVDEGSPLAVSLTAPFDPSSIDSAGLEYAFDLGAGYGAFSASNSASVTPADNGTVTVRAKVRDKDGGVTEYTRIVTVNNVAPTLTVSGPAAVGEGSAYSLALGTVVDPGTDSVSGYTIHWGDGTDETFTGSPSGLTRTHAYANGAAGGTGRTISVDLTDEDGTYLGVASQNVTVNNVAPTVALSGPAAAAEGQTKHYTFTASDPGADTLSVSATGGGSVGTVSNLAFDPATRSGSFDVTFADGPATSTVSVRVADSDGATSNLGTVDVAVANVAPVIDSLVTPLDPVAAGSPSPVNVTATFADPGTADSFTVQWNWGDGSSADPIHLSPTDSKSLTASHYYTTPGVYTITLTVTDKDGGTAIRPAASYVVVYDPSAGFVTGGGWITSPAGAYAADPTATGKATFGFEAKYQKGASTPTGNTQFLFATAGFEFKSTSYDWLVVSGAKAQYKGSGTINGSGDYGFLLTAWDGQRTGGGGTDRLRLKVWNKATGLVVYDNQMGAADGADPSTALGGGSIQIHDAH